MCAPTPPIHALDVSFLRFRPFCGLMIWMALVAAMLAGCGSSLATVHGKVTLPSGEPAEGVIVTFEESQRHIGATGTADASGVYHLGTAVPGDGTPPGKYVVSVHQPGPANSSDPEPPRIFPKRYERSSTSELSFEVQPGDNTFDIQLRPQ